MGQAGDLGGCGFDADAGFASASVLTGVASEVVIGSIVRLFASLFALGVPAQLKLVEVQLQSQQVSPPVQVAG